MGMQVLTCDATPDDPGSAFGAKRKQIYTENPHFHMNARQWECMARSEKIPSEGGEDTLYTPQSVVCMEERGRAGVCALHLSKDEPEGIQEIKEKPMGKRIGCFCLSGEKKI